jgi:hypothetical protein
MNHVLYFMMRSAAEPGFAAPPPITSCSASAALLDQANNGGKCGLLRGSDGDHSIQASIGGVKSPSGTILSVNQ